MQENLVKYFIDQTNARFDKHEEKTEARFNGVDRKLDDLYRLRWIAFGITAGVSAAVTFAFQLFSVYLKSHG